MEDNKIKDNQQNIFIYDKKKICVSGVKEVYNFNEEQITYDTIKGAMILKGKSLHIDKLNLETKELIVTGNVESLAYKDTYKNKKTTLIQKIFK